MGYIVDFEMPVPAPARRPRSRPHRTLDEETPLVPRAVAEAVHEEASVWLGVALPAAWIPQLIRKAETVAARNVHFRRRLLASGDAGRDWLWAFMRHWLSAFLLKKDRTLHLRLPISYSVGRPPAFG